MSILIKDMEMPKSCSECELMINCDSCEGWECYCTALSKSIGYESEIFTDKRREDCPLVPVPEHGDLIDRDKAEVIAYMEEDVGRDFADGILFAADWIRQQPTIIPAEEGE